MFVWMSEFQGAFALSFQMPCRLEGTFDRTAARRNHEVATIVEVELLEEEAFFRVLVARTAVVVADERLRMLGGCSVVEVEFHAPM